MRTEFRPRPDRCPINAHVPGRDCGFTQDTQAVLLGRAVVETRFGLLARIDSSRCAGRKREVRGQWYLALNVEKVSTRHASSSIFSITIMVSQLAVALSLAAMSVGISPNASSKHDSKRMNVPALSPNTR